MMNKLTNFADAETALRRYIRPLDAPGSYTLDRLRAVMHYLGDPQDSYKTIHVAGTSGKTSTCYYLASMLHEAGFKVGHTISPHVTSIAERAQINLQNLPEDVYCERLSRFLQAIEQSGIELSYFEVLIAFAYTVFAEEKVEYAVIEVGLGGLLDGTNVITRSDKVCVVTDIGYDHVQILGHTLPEITAQKAGIIQAKNVVFMYDQSNAVTQVVSTRCNVVSAQLHLIEPSPHDDRVAGLPLFQQRNWHLALEVIAFTLRRDGRQPLTARQLRRTTQTLVPGRMEAINYGAKVIILDGAHNEQKIRSLVESIKAKYPGKTCALLVSFGDNKYDSIEPALHALTALGTSVIVTEFSLGQDLPRKPIPAASLATYATAAGFSEVIQSPNPAEAFRMLLRRPEEVLLSTGSFFILNHIHQQLKQLGIA